ncbi:hypothetical protein LOAG_03854 [Loa loa]|uniref:Uncharacterized protein n=1 Tax=Loa loa TaxID=7209 RepID=A0A1S0U589_LOALO|nr:hypothetical protein LOAG_03854 [Loa loa]EFO24635.1 hypothetical protein LOAG_03854 [Loa loa]
MKHRVRSFHPLAPSTVFTSATAAVIPALKVYIMIAAVKKLVVGSASQDLIHSLDENWAPS